MSLAGQTALVEARARALPGQGASSAKVTRPFWRPQTKRSCSKEMSCGSDESDFEGDELCSRRLAVQSMNGVGGSLLC